MADVYEDYFHCGSCQRFEVAFTDRMGRTLGQCFRKPRRATIAAHDFACDDYRLQRDRLIAGAKVPDDAPVATPREQMRRRALEQATASHKRGTKKRRPRTVHIESKPKIQEIPLGEEGEDVDRDELKDLLAEVIDEALAMSDPPMHPRYRGGKLVIHPANEELAAKEVPIDIFFRKITTVRDKLRVLEQKVNGNKALEPDERAQMQGYITGCYGALKTFNMLFADRDDWFNS
ncbi:MAG: hypothetical protein KC502_01850 [Myxococcales bacterium]|nr:hypothetical protein [Myxococcales bacterium]